MAILKLRLLFLTFSIFSFLTGKTQEVPVNDYTIYKSVLLKNHQRKIKPLVVINKTANDTLIKHFLTHSKDLDKEYNDSIWKMVFKTSFDSSAFKLYQLFEKFTPKVLLVKNKFNWSRKVNIISQEEIKDFFQEPRQSGFEKFYSYFPNVKGYYEFSEILYSADRNFAILYYALSVNTYKGNGRIAILKNEGNIWNVKYECNIWGY